jgi:hypothetical protein
VIDQVPMSACGTKRTCRSYWAMFVVGLKRKTSARSEYFAF